MLRSLRADAVTEMPNGGRMERKAQGHRTDIADGKRPIRSREEF